MGTGRVAQCCQALHHARDSLSSAHTPGRGTYQPQNAQLNICPCAQGVRTEQKRWQRREGRWGLVRKPGKVSQRTAPARVVQRPWGRRLLPGGQPAGLEHRVEAVGVVRSECGGQGTERLWPGLPTSSSRAPFPGERPGLSVSNSAPSGAGRSGCWGCSCCLTLALGRCESGEACLLLLMCLSGLGAPEGLPAYASSEPAHQRAPRREPSSHCLSLLEGRGRGSGTPRSSHNATGRGGKQRWPVVASATFTLSTPRSDRARWITALTYRERQGQGPSNKGGERGSRPLPGPGQGWPEGERRCTAVCAPRSLPPG